MHNICRQGFTHAIFIYCCCIPPFPSCCIYTCTCTCTTILFGSTILVSYVLSFTCEWVMFACVIFTACICVTRKYVLRVIGVSAPSLHWQAVASQPSHSAGGGSLFLSIMVRSCRHLPGGGGGGGGERLPAHHAQT